MKLPCAIYLFLSLCANAASGGSPTTAPAAGPAHAFLLHLPGVSGESAVDHSFVRGLKAAKFDAEIEIYDWTENDPGVPALQARARNLHEAQLIAEKITAKFRADPHATMYLTAHSGGAGLAVWALAKLPEDVKIDSLLLLAPALSPDYDLTAALSHVRRSAYAFYSEYDVAVLGAGTKAFGTIDGVHTAAAGLNGFSRPATADAAQYAKLIQFPYDPRWLPLAHAGDHIGPMAAPFAKGVLAPLLTSGPKAGQTTRPVLPATTQP